MGTPAKIIGDVDHCDWGTSPIAMVYVPNLPRKGRICNIYSMICLVLGNNACYDKKRRFEIGFFGGYVYEGCFTKVSWAWE